jgi:hypothetical protein
VNRDSGTDSANGGWLRRLVRRLNRHTEILSRNFRRNQIILAITETVNKAEMTKIADQQWQSYLARSYCPGESGVAPSQAKKNVAYIASPETKIRANKMIQYFLIRSKPPNSIIRPHPAALIFP